jgi:hypothetical protein
MPHMLSRGIDPVIATAALSFSPILNIPSRIAIGWMGDVYSKKWLLNATAIAGGLALLAFALIGPTSTELVWMYAILWAVGLAMLPLQAAWVAETYGRAHYGSITPRAIRSPYWSGCRRAGCCPGVRLARQLPCRDAARRGRRCGGGNHVDVPAFTDVVPVTMLWSGRAREANSG